MSNPLSMLFGKSPIKPLQEHMGVVSQCAGELSDFFKAAIASDWQAAEATYDRICVLENKADDIKRELRLHMPKGMFMPVSRSDLLELLTVQDNIANRARDIAGLMLGRHMAIPEPVQEEMRNLVDAAITVTGQALKIINELDELLETGFVGREVDFVESLISELDDKERVADVLERTIRHKLFAIEKDYHPIDMMFLYDIIEKVGGLANRARRVGGRLQTLVAR
ncbi:MAG: phosphate transport regulator [Gammaproteobacteria bacterium BRH_c0]|nr:MAG: phosphate transport regulator [Gammaproteobacteria bacterium BRH_c0]